MRVFLNGTVMRLTLKQKRFCEHFAGCGNATLAAKLAGYSKKTARFIGCENLTKINIRLYMRALVETIDREARSHWRFPRGFPEQYVEDSTARHFDARILNSAQKRELIRAQLKETPELSNRSIANWLGVSHATVAAQRGKLEESGEIERFST